MQNNIDNKVDSTQQQGNAVIKKAGSQSIKASQQHQHQQDESKTQQTNQQQDQNNKQEQSKIKYILEKVIGQGTFGCVYLASSSEIKGQVAIKKVYQDKRFKNRELQIIKCINHINIVRLLTAYFSPSERSSDDLNLNLVMEYIPDTLSKVIRQYRKLKQQFPPHLVKVYSYQMFRGLAYLLGINICHRDIKPQNILVDNTTMILKICDFGSAKKLSPNEVSVSYICSRYYRAPELIFGSQYYTNAIDVWSMGCVVAEMVTGEPLFPGESAVDQLVEIIKILGTPTLDQVKAMNQEQHEFKFPQIKALPWNKVFQKYKVDPLLVELLAKILVYPPNLRPKPLEVLQHQYFSELRTEQFKQMYPNCPDLFNFTKEEIQTNPEIMPSLVPAWYNPNIYNNTTINKISDMSQQSQQNNQDFHIQDKQQYQQQQQQMKPVSIIQDHDQVQTNNIENSNNIGSNSNNGNSNQYSDTQGKKKEILIQPQVFSSQQSQPMQTQHLQQQQQQQQEYQNYQEKV